ncbi:MAG: DUF2807 domain-containing protein [Phaeodactylibacter sp.]|nr:DUF2807 domain-containing protein [Phaeodactylibacter sp.]MCB9292575.1 DUF2807 domain-containing protein [Lewinellaceae bacterium]
MITNRIAALFVLFALLFSSCITDYDGGGSFFGQGIKGEGPVTSKALELNGFTKISLGTPGEVFLSQGEAYSFRVEAQQNIIDNLETKINGEELEIGFDKSVRSYESLKFYITMPTLEEVNLAGSGDVAGETPFSGLGNFEANIAGAGNVSLSLEARAVSLSIAGSGDIELDGTAESVEVNIMGSGSVRAESLSTPTADINIAGSGDCAIDATKKLDVSIAGSGDVYYLGSPEISKSIAGSGSVKKK